MRRFFKVEMAADGWGLMVNEGTADEPKFRVVLKGSERWMERMAVELNSSQSATFAEGASRTGHRFLETRRHDQPSSAKAAEGRQERKTNGSEVQG